MTYIGIDYSTTRTGIATFDPRTGEWDTASIKSAPGETGLAAYYERIRDLAARIINWTDPHQGDVIVVESIAFNARGSKVDGLHYAWHRTVEALTDHHGEPFLITPTQVKKLATGNGGAGKDEVLLATAKRVPAAPAANSDESDAVWLAVAASYIDGHPMIELPITHVQTLTKAIR